MFKIVEGRGGRPHMMIRIDQDKLQQLAHRYQFRQVKQAIFQKKLAEELKNVRH